MNDNKAYLHPKTGNLMTPKVRMGWTALFTPTGMKGEPADKAKYQFTALIPKDADFSVLKEAAQTAATDKFGAKSKGLKSPFRKSAENEKLVEAGLADDFPFYFTARSKDRPGIVGPNGKAVDDPEQTYPGRWARASIQVFAYDTAGNKGVSFGLQNVQLLDHDDPIAIGGGRVAAEQEFDAVEGVAGNDAASSDDVFA